MRFFLISTARCGLQAPWTLRGSGAPRGSLARFSLPRPPACRRSWAHPSLFSLTRSLAGHYPAGGVHRPRGFGQEGSPMKCDGCKLPLKVRVCLLLEWIAPSPTGSCFQYPRMVTACPRRAAAGPRGGGGRGGPRALRLCRPRRRPRRRPPRRGPRWFTRPRFVTTVIGSTSAVVKTVIGSTSAM